MHVLPLEHVSRESIALVIIVIIVALVFVGTDGRDFAVVWVVVLDHLIGMLLFIQTLIFIHDRSLVDLVD